jgi:hypothetical protein
MMPPDDLHPGDPPDMDPPEGAPRRADVCQVPPPWEDEWYRRFRAEDAAREEREATKTENHRRQR